MQYLDELDVVVLRSQLFEDIVHLDAGRGPSSPKVQGIDGSGRGLEDGSKFVVRGDDCVVGRSHCNGMRGRGRERRE